MTASRGPFRWAASAQGSQPAEKEHEKAQKNLVHPRRVRGKDRYLYRAHFTPFYIAEVRAICMQAKKRLSNASLQAKPRGACVCLRLASCKGVVRPARPSGLASGGSGTEFARRSVSGQPWSPLASHGAQGYRSRDWQANHGDGHQHRRKGQCRRWHGGSDQVFDQEDPAWRL